MATRASPPPVPVGNLRIGARIRWLLRRDYFYTESTRPTGENPLLLNLTGYLTLAMILEVLFAYYLQAIQSDLFLLGYVAELTLSVFLLVFVLHLVLWTVSVLWRIGRGHASLRS